jgi:hypothetical protein
MVIRFRLELSDDDRRRIARQIGSKSRKATREECKSYLLGEVIEDAITTLAVNDDPDTLSNVGSLKLGN